MTACPHERYRDVETCPVCEAEEERDAAFTLLREWRRRLIWPQDQELILQIEAVLDSAAPASGVGLVSGYVQAEDEKQKAERIQRAFDYYMVPLIQVHPTDEEP